MNDAAEDRLATEFASWVATMPHAEAVQRCRELGDDHYLALSMRAHDDVAAFLHSSRGYDEDAEQLARRLEVLADAEAEVDPFIGYSSAADLREAAHDVRHPDQWRAEAAEASERNQISETRAEALALAASCSSSEGTVEARLQHIEEVLPRLNELAEQAHQRGDISEEFAVGTDIAGVIQVRDHLRHAR